jgi:Rrf2 family protein
MLQVPVSVEYGLRAMVYLAQKHAGVRPIRAAEIASQEGLPLPFLQRLLARLQRAGLVASSRGVHGGHRLARLPEAIRVLEIVEALTAPIAQAPGPRLGLDFLWQRGLEAWRQALDVPLAQLAREVEERERHYTYQI